VGDEHPPLPSPDSPPPCLAPPPRAGNYQRCTEKTSSWDDCRCPSEDPTSWPRTWSSMQNRPLDKTKLDARCCLIDWLANGCDPEANELTKSRIDFRVKSQPPTDLWAALSTNELQSGSWNFRDGPICLVRSNVSRGQVVSMRFPPGWSGNTFATRAGWVSSQAEQQVKWGGAAHSILLEYTFGCTVCNDQSVDEQFWWDLSAIPNSEPGQCVSQQLMHHSCKQAPTQCSPALQHSAVVYGNNDAECLNHTSKAADPGGWYEWQNDPEIDGDWAKVPPWGADIRAPSTGHGYRFGWFGSPACYNYDDCKRKATDGGVDAFLNGRGFKVTIPYAPSSSKHTSHCAFDGWKGYWRDGNHKQSHTTGVAIAACTFGRTHAEIGGTEQDCMTSPHEDWKSLACLLNHTLANEAARNGTGKPLHPGDNSSLVLTVDVCQWGDKLCTGNQIYPDPPPVPHVYACDSSVTPKQLCCHGSYPCPGTNLCRCGNGTQPPAPPGAVKYTCTGTPLKRCIPDSNGNFSSAAACNSSCINRFTCTGSPVTHCVQAANGHFTSPAACNMSCSKPSPPPPPTPPAPTPQPGKYTCTGTPLKKCISDANGKFNSLEACNRSCINRFTCTGSPVTHCVQAANGKYTSIEMCQSSGCGKTPSPSPPHGPQCNPHARPPQLCKPKQQAVSEMQKATLLLSSPPPTSASE